MRKPRRSRVGEKYIVYVETGLTWKQALAQALKIKPRGRDYRAFTYEPRTGRACFV